MDQDYIVMVGGDASRASFLIKGDKQNILYDAGMAYSSPQLIENVKRELGGRPLDAVILSHSHYDHIMGFPYLKREWPELIVYSSEYAKKIIEKPSARRLMRELAENAAAKAGCELPAYRDEELVIDRTFADGEVLRFGDIKAEVFATPGHTKCSTSFAINDEIMLCSETTGVPTNSGKTSWVPEMPEPEYFRSHSLDELLPMLTYMPCYLVGYGMSLASLKHMREARVKRALIIHVGVFSNNPAADVFDYMYEEMEKTRADISGIIRSCRDEEERMQEMLRLYHQGIDHLQPEKAFRLNAAATLKVIEKEFF